MTTAFLTRAIRAAVLLTFLSGLTTIPVSAGTTGKIAGKVINHYGDEVLKVYEVR